MSAVAKALQVSRSQIYERLSQKNVNRSRYRMAEDSEIIRQMQPIIDAKPTYGYRRITGRLNAVRALAGLPPVNHKRVFRLMSMNGWLLQKYTPMHPGRVHDGKVIVMQSNLRWCSDAFEFTCWDGETVSVAFIIDAFDREIIAYGAVPHKGVAGGLIRDIMLEAVEARFKDVKTPRIIEFLSDNGSCYIAKKTKLFATSLGLKPCFTPVRSPQSNGMAESFVKTFKRDYVHVNPLPSSSAVINALHGWFKDYNEYHPHSGLKWKSPRQFRRTQT